MSETAGIRHRAASYAGDPRSFLMYAWHGLAGSVGVARLLFVANLRARHRRALIGYVWLVVPAVATAITFTMLRRSQLFTTGELDLPYALFVLSGVLLWQCFGDALTTPVNQLRDHADFLALVPAPLEGVILAALLDVFLNSAVRMAVVCLAMAGFGIMPELGWLTGLLPAALLLILTGLALGLLTAPLALLYDDVANALGLIATFGLFLVPALYPIPADSFFAYNPLVAVLDWARAGMAGLSHSVPWELALAAAVLLPAGWLFNVAARPHLSARTR